jgi:hypothetical protein
MDNCLGNSRLGNYAIQTLVSGNFRKGCAVKTATSTDPQEYTPNVSSATPHLALQISQSACAMPIAAILILASTKILGDLIATPSATLAKTCCADGSSKGLGLVPGWDRDPAVARQSG